jgi:hypothetical protein
MLKNLIKAILPSKILPLTYLTYRTIKKARGEVQSGPFSGMRYIEKAYCSSICPKLTGTYEKEIQNTINQLMRQKFDAFIDIGSAEGYYSIGFAKYGNCKKIYSFECSEEARKLQQRLAEKNEVKGKLRLLGSCNCKNLRSVLKENVLNLILCDVEGFEYALLDLEKIPELATATMIIECHHHVWDQMESALIDRFSKTHNSQSFKANIDGDPKDYPFRNFYYDILPRKYKNFPILDQRAPETTWLYLKPEN